MDGGRYVAAAALAAALAATAACSAGHRGASPPPAPAAPTPGPSDPFADEWALRVSFPPDPDTVEGSLDRTAVRAGGAFRVTGTSDCGLLHARLDLGGFGDVTATVRMRGGSAFTAEGVVPRGTPPQEATVVVTTACGRPESSGSLVLPLRVTA